MPSKLDPKDFECVDLTGETVIKDNLQGQSFVIENCKKCEIQLLDITTQVQIDECEDCVFIVGPVAGSIFIRDCHRCVVFVISQQLRTRDCEDIEFFLKLVTRPIIEQTKNCKIAPWTQLYPRGRDHIIASGIVPNENIWSNVYDFSPEWDKKSRHWELMESNHACARQEKFFGQKLGTLPQKQALNVEKMEKGKNIVEENEDDSGVETISIEEEETTSTKVADRGKAVILNREKSMEKSIALVTKMLNEGTDVRLLGFGSAIQRAVFVATSLSDFTHTVTRTFLARRAPGIEIRIAGKPSY